MLLGCLILLDGFLMGFAGVSWFCYIFCLFWSVFVGCWRVLMALVAFWWVLLRFCWCSCQSYHSDSRFPWRWECLFEAISADGQPPNATHQELAETKIIQNKHKEWCARVWGMVGCSVCGRVGVFQKTSWIKLLGLLAETCGTLAIVKV